MEWHLALKREGEKRQQFKFNLCLDSSELTQDDQLQTEEDPRKSQSTQSVERGILGMLPFDLLRGNKENKTKDKISQQRSKAYQCSW